MYPMFLRFSQNFRLLKALLSARAPPCSPLGSFQNGDLGKKVSGWWFIVVNGG